jgi:hypothetical protein
MKKIIIPALLLMISAGSFAQANRQVESLPGERRFGLGLIVGEPTGISAKYWTSGKNALAFGVGWQGGSVVRVRRFDGWYYTGTRFHFHTDYLWHDFNAIRSTERFPLYYGVGALLATGGVDPGVFGVRGVFGIAWLPRAPLDVFLEIAPTLQIAPGTWLGFGAGLGVRYFF